MKQAFIIVCGSQGFNNFRIFERKFKRLTKSIEHPIIITGGATGADGIAEGFAKFRYIPYLVFPAAWRPKVLNEDSTVDKAAGIKRNEKMAKFAAQNKPSFCIAFWDGRSKGTADMIARARKYKIPTRVILYRKIK